MKINFGVHFDWGICKLFPKDFSATINIYQTTLKFEQGIRTNSNPKGRSCELSRCNYEYFYCPSNVLCHKEVMGNTKWDISPSKAAQTV